MSCGWGGPRWWPCTPPGTPLTTFATCARRTGCSSPATMSWTAPPSSSPPLTGTWLRTWTASAAWPPCPASPPSPPGTAPSSPSPTGAWPPTWTTAWTGSGPSSTPWTGWAGPRWRTSWPRSTPTYPTPCTPWPASRCGPTCASWRTRDGLPPATPTTWGLPGARHADALHPLEEARRASAHLHRGDDLLEEAVDDAHEGGGDRVGGVEDGRPPRVAARRHGRVEGHRAHEGHPDLVGQGLAPARAEELVSGAVVAREGAHVLDHPRHPQPALAGHVRHPGGYPGGGLGRSGDDQHLGAGQRAGQAHLDVPGAGGHVDEQVVEGAPADVLDEVLDGPVEQQAPPHDGLTLGLREQAHGHHLQLPLAQGTHGGHDGPFVLRPLGFEAALEAEHAGHREAPDVGVEQPHGVAPAGEGGGQVDGHGRLAHPALAGGHRHDPGRRAELVGVCPLASLPAGPGHDGLALLGRHGADLDLHSLHPRQGS